MVHLRHMKFLLMQNRRGNFRAQLMLRSHLLCQLSIRQSLHGCKSTKSSYFYSLLATYSVCGKPPVPPPFLYGSSSTNRNQDQHHPILILVTIEECECNKALKDNHTNRCQMIKKNKCQRFSKIPQMAEK